MITCRRCGKLSPPMPPGSATYGDTYTAALLWAQENGWVIIHRFLARSVAFCPECAVKGDIKNE